MSLLSGPRHVQINVTNSPFSIATLKIRASSRKTAGPSIRGRPSNSAAASRKSR
jgi:hypothetical protein